MSQFVAHLLQFQEIIVYKFPLGGGGMYSQPKVSSRVVSTKVWFRNSYFRTSILKKCHSKLADFPLCL